MVLLASMIFVLNASYGFIKEYKAFGVLTDIKIQSVSEITLPAVSLRETSPQKFVCYENKTAVNNDICNCNVAVPSFSLMRSKTHLNLHAKDQGHTDIYRDANGASNLAENT